MRRFTRCLLLTLFVALMLQPLPAYAQESGPIYIVQPGDTLSGIARRFGISQEALVQANGILDPSRLFPGDALLLPGFESIEGELTLRPLNFGESIESLSVYYGVDVLDLARLNRIVRIDGAYAGQAVIVPVGVEGVESGERASPELVTEGDTSLERSAHAGISPWEQRQSDEISTRYWMLPGRIPFDVKGRGTIALPAFLSDLAIGPEPLTQGKTAVIETADIEGHTVSGSLNEYDLRFFPDEGDRLVALQGIHALQEPGLMTLAVVVRSAETNQIVYGYDQRVLLDAGDYGFRVLNGVPSETVDPAFTQPEETLIQELLSPKTETRLWDDAFELPSRYYVEEFISLFGTRRNYNNGALLYYHTGLDFYGQNVPIYAPADGIVVFADALTVRGNATYIDHGWGVFSGYLHQSEMYVQAGDRVERGQVIGQVGATGRVTGPHLHWEIWVGGVPVEPLDWVAAIIP